VSLARGVRFFVLVTMAVVLAGRAGAETPTNVALGRPYTLESAPSYALCTDPGDSSQLTDGFETTNNFWTEKTTVGWQRHSPVAITIDLGRVTAIAGAAFHTAAGKAGVEWPAAIYVLASDDGKEFFSLGDLVSLSNGKNGEPGPGYRIHTYATQALKSHGRFVRFIVDASGPFVFADEIMVFSGPKAWIGQPMAGAVCTDTGSFFVRSLVQRRVVAALRRDLALARERVAASAALPEMRKLWNEDLAKLEMQIASLPPIDLETFRAVLPMGPVHAAIFALIGRVEAASGNPTLTAWRANPWDFLTPFDTAPPVATVLPALSLLRGETRAVAINIRNASGEPMDVKLAVDGLGSGGPPQVAEVAWTETQEGFPVAAALPEARRDGSGFRIAVPAGMTRQVWLWVSAAGLSPGVHTATVVLTRPVGAPLEIRVPARVVGVDFPNAPRLHIGGWDYTNTDSLYGLTAQNVPPLIAHLRSRGVDSPWATSQAMPFGDFDADGRLVSPPGTESFDRWVMRWPNARRYMVFLDVKDSLGVIGSATPAFRAAVSAWLRFWVSHAREKGIRPEQIYLLLVDEPNDAAATGRLMPWSHAIREADAGVKIFEDPIFERPDLIPPAFASAVDVLCVNRAFGQRSGAPFWNSAAALRSAALSLEIYGADGPTRTMDPYGYYRLQAWRAFAIGGEGSSFWAFADTGGVNSWNELAGTRKSFTPLFLSPDSVTAGKHMEALAESAHDFEVLALLREASVVVAGRGPETPDLARARALLEEGPARVLGAPSADAFPWTQARDRGLADEVRTEAADLLARLRGAAAP